MSTVTLDSSNDTDFRLDSGPLRAVAEKICNAEMPGGECEIGLLICDDATIRKYNLLYRGDDQMTDVLCFSLSDTLPSDITKGNQAVICDILIDIKQLERQKGHKSIQQELMEIFIHGLLHGFGYDHIRTEARIQMIEKEKYYKELMEGTQQSG